jgi:hypothetical protein
MSDIKSSDKKIRKNLASRPQPSSQQKEKGLNEAEFDDSHLSNARHSQQDTKYRGS